MQKTSAPSLQQVSSAQETPLTNQRTKKYDLPHMIIPDEDMAWALEQRSPVDADLSKLALAQATCSEFGVTVTIEEVQ